MTVVTVLYLMLTRFYFTELKKDLIGKPEHSCHNLYPITQYITVEFILKSIQF